jgi:hypothetical protein
MSTIIHMCSEEEEETEILEKEEEYILRHNAVRAL